MPINVKCHSCGKAYRLNDSLTGRKFKCKDCGVIVLATPIPDAPPIAARSAKPAGQRPPVRPATSAGSQSVPVKKKRPAPAAPVKKKPVPEPYAEEYDDDDFADDFAPDYDDGLDDGYDPYGAPPAPRRKKKTSSGKSKSKKSSSGGGLPPMTFNLNRLNALLVMGGCLLMFFGCQEMRLSQRAGANPKAVTLQELTTNGPGSDVYFTVSGVVPVNDGYVADETKTKRMTAVWFPCRPAESPNATSSFVVYSTSAPTEDDVATLMMSQTHTGMIINSIKGLDRETKTLLRQNMPGVDVETALIFHVGRTPSGVVKYVGMLLGGLMLALAGLAWILFVHE
ncbi:MAG: hypothetical protein R3C59_00555 [Planctomycetaceae bacterium]